MKNQYCRKKLIYKELFWAREDRTEIGALFNILFQELEQAFGSGLIPGLLQITAVLFPSD
jgi:hypothetical protein